MATCCLLAVAALLIISAPAILGSGRHVLSVPATTTASTSEGTRGKTTTSTPLATAHLTGSGLEVPFPGIPGQAYCVLSDPCIHVNAVLEGDSSSTWVSGYAVKAGIHTVILKVTKSGDDVMRSGEYRVVLKGEDYNTVVTLNNEPVHNIIDDNGVAETSDEEVAIELWNPKNKEILVTVKKCHVRLLFRVQEGKDVLQPIVSVDVLDWDSLHAPHGIIGQTFPNHANPEALASRTRKSLHSTEAQSNEAARIPGALWSVPTRIAMRMVKSVEARKVELDGVPEDYLCSGFAEPDCVFSQFEQEWNEQKPEQQAHQVSIDEHGATIHEQSRAARRSDTVKEDSELRSGSAAVKTSWF